jgi:hypothetical protein
MSDHFKIEIHAGGRATFPSDQTLKILWSLLCLPFIPCCQYQVSFSVSIMQKSLVAPWGEVVL